MRGDDQSDLEDRYEQWAAAVVESIANLANVKRIDDSYGIRQHRRKGQVPPNMPKLSGAEKADLLKQRKQSKMKMLERTARGNSFQQQQLALGKGKPRKTKMLGKEKVGRMRRDEAAAKEDEPKEEGEEEEEAEEEEEDRVNNTFVGIEDIDDYQKSSVVKQGNGGCCDERNGESKKDRERRVLLLVVVLPWVKTRSRVEQSIQTCCLLKMITMRKAWMRLTCYTSRRGRVPWT